MNYPIRHHRYVWIMTKSWTPSGGGGFYEYKPLRVFLVRENKNSLVYRVEGIGFDYMSEKVPYFATAQEVIDHQLFRLYYERARAENVVMELNESITQLRQLAEE